MTTDYNFDINLINRLINLICYQQSIISNLRAFFFYTLLIKYHNENTLNCISTLSNEYKFPSIKQFRTKENTKS